MRITSTDPVTNVIVLIALLLPVFSVCGIVFWCVGEAQARYGSVRVALRVVMSRWRSGNNLGTDRDLPHSHALERPGNGSGTAWEWVGNEAGMDGEDWEWVASARHNTYMPIDLTIHSADEALTWLALIERDGRQLSATAVATLVGGQRMQELIEQVKLLRGEIASARERQGGDRAETTDVQGEAGWLWRQGDRPGRLQRVEEPS